ncbi:MAG: CPBP family intramembrane glutamic endopeptidase [Gemmataceae bacterium]
MAIFQLMASNSGVEHPLTLLFRSGRTMDVWIVIALVVVIAPVTEEVLFRGFFQAWIISSRLGPLVGWCMALALVACFIPNQIYSPQDDTQGTSKLFVYAQIAAYLLIGAALILLAGRFSHLAASAVAGAMVFSAVHAFAWPSPAGLLPLACGLVWLREKTGRLWPCMLVHAAFNGLGTLLMIVTH